MRAALALCGALLAGCSSLLGIQDLRPSGDAGVDTPGDGAGQRIRVNGHATQVTGVGIDPCMMCSVDLVQNDLAIATTTTAPQGVFTLDFTAQLPLDATLRVANRTTGLIDTQMLFAKPLRGDTMSVEVFVFDQGGITALAMLAGDVQPAGDVMLLVHVVDEAGPPIPGVVLTTDLVTARVRYSDGNMLPSMDTVATGTDGVAFVFGVPPTKITLQASKPGLAFPSRQVTLVANNVFIVELSPGVPTP